MDGQTPVAVMTIPTMPRSKQRPRFYQGTVLTPKITKEYMSLLRRSWTHGVIDGEELSIVMVFAFPPNCKWSRKRKRAVVGRACQHKPDIDNLIKAVLDALNGIAYTDDSKISSVYASKQYRLEPSVTVAIFGGTKEETKWPVKQ